MEAESALVAKPGVVPTTDGEMRVFQQFTEERLDWVFAWMLGGAWVLELVCSWLIAAQAGHDGPGRFHTLACLSAFLVCIPIALVIVRPGLAVNQVLIGGAWAALSLLGGWAVLQPGTPAWMIRVWAGFLPVAVLAFYPQPRALLSAAVIFVAGDLSMALGWIHSSRPFPGYWVGHATWLAVAAIALSLLIRSRNVSVRQLLDRQFRRAVPIEDRLTGLALRPAAVAFLDERLNPPAEADARSGSPSPIAAVIAIDIDHLKHINETLGVSAGDAVVQQAAKRFSSCIRATDFIARAAKDEFLIVIPNLSDALQAESMTRRLLESMQTPFDHDGATVFATASLGLSFSPNHGRDAQTLIGSAEQALAAAKHAGRSSYRVFETSLAPAKAGRTGIESDLHQALERGELQLHYQPQVNASGRVVCVEALLRWRHPQHGFIPPSDFIPLAEASGLILPIGEWVLNEACRQGAQWISAGLPPTRMAVNVSPVQFGRPQFVEQVALAIAASGFDACLLELEITETLLMIDHEAACDRIARLQSLGVQVSIDDFGMGYSSLAYLQQLPVNALKIDRNFVSALDTSASALPLLAAIIMLAHSLNLEVVVEGVETDSQRETVWSLGADKAQGYFFARPQPPADVDRLLRAPGHLAA